MMNLSLAIETSSEQYQIVLGQHGHITFDSAQTGSAEHSGDLSRLVLQGLHTIGAQPKDIASIALDVGPGKLSHVRSGVSFANALAFSLRIPMFPFNYFEIIGNQARMKTLLPILCAVPAVADSAYVGLFTTGSVTAMRYGPLVTTTREIAAGLAEFAVAGRLRERLCELLHHANVIDTGIEKPDANTIFQMSVLAQEQGKPTALQVAPLNDQSPIFYQCL